MQVYYVAFGQIPHTESLKCVASNVCSLPSVKKQVLKGDDLRRINTLRTTGDDETGFKTCHLMKYSERSKCTCTMLH